MAFIGFLLLIRMPFLKLSCSFLTTSVFHGSLYLALGLVNMHSTAASIWAIFLFVNWIMSFSRFLKSLKLVSHNYCILIAYITMCKWRPVISWSFNSFLFLHRLKQIFAVTILWLEDSLSKEEYASQFKALFILLFFMNI